MGDQRDGGIAWTEETWNPIRGCSPVSEGCRNCYAARVATRFSGPGQPYEGLVALRQPKNGSAPTHGGTGAVRTGIRGRWNGTVRMVPEHLTDPLRWRRPRMVFVNSMSDLFHESLTNEQIAAVFGVMAAAPRHTFQVLTKRAKRMREWCAWVQTAPLDPFGCGPRASRLCLQHAFREVPPDYLMDVHIHNASVSPVPWPLPNVWIGVSVEDQATADERIPELLRCPAAVRWVSLEPQIGPVDLSRPGWLWGGRDDSDREVDALDWIVVGGESGPGARPFDLAWARSTVAQCRTAGVPCFVKQLGARPVVGPRDLRGLVMGQLDATDRGQGDDRVVLRLRHPKGGDPSEWPDDLRVREWPEVPRG